MIELLNKVHCADALQFAKSMPSQSVNCVVTSPPYWMLRDYQTLGQLGSEPTVKDYITSLLTLFREIHRILRDDGIMWLNMGDSYSGSGKGPSQNLQSTNAGSLIDKRTKMEDLEPKNLIGQPWRLALALQGHMTLPTSEVNSLVQAVQQRDMDYLDQWATANELAAQFYDMGWILRLDCLWHKPNPMPSSAKDRPTLAHEYVFLFAKSRRYWFDLEPMKTPVKKTSIKRLGRAVSPTHKNHNGAPGQTPHSVFRARPNLKQDLIGKRTYTAFNERYDNNPVPMANPRSVFRVSVKGFPGNHFATFPPALIHPLIEAGCPPLVCSACKQPYVRQTEKVFVPQPDVSAARGMKNANGQKPMATNNRWGNYARGTMATQLSVWRPACHCKADTVPGVVYDPFMGSGTVGVVAKELKRDYIGSELNPDYAKDAQVRIDAPPKSHKVKVKVKPESQLPEFVTLPLFPSLEAETA